MATTAVSSPEMMKMKGSPVPQQQSPKRRLEESGPTLDPLNTSSENALPSIRSQEDLSEESATPSQPLAKRQKMDSENEEKKFHSIPISEIQWKFNPKQMSSPFTEFVPSFTPRWVMGILWNKYRKWKGVPKHLVYVSVTSSMKKHRDRDGHIILNKGNMDLCLELMLASCPYLQIQLLPVKDKDTPESCLSITKEGAQWCLKWLTANKRVKGETDKQAEDMGLLQTDQDSPPDHHPNPALADSVTNVATLSTSGTLHAQTGAQIVSTHSQSGFEFPEVSYEGQSEFWSSIQNSVSIFNEVLHSKKLLEDQMKVLQEENAKLREENQRLQQQISAKVLHMESEESELPPPVPLQHLTSSSTETSSK